MTNVTEELKKEELEINQDRAFIRDIADRACDLMNRGFAVETFIEANKKQVLSDIKEVGTEALRKEFNELAQEAMRICASCMLYLDPKHCDQFQIKPQSGELFPPEYQKIWSYLALAIQATKELPNENIQMILHDRTVSLVMELTRELGKKNDCEDWYYAQLEKFQIFPED